MTRIVAAAAFFLGLVLGLGLSVLVTLLTWLAVGTVLVLIFDVAAGLSQRACDLRSRIRRTVRRWRGLERAADAEVRVKRVYVNY